MFKRKKSILMLVLALVLIFSATSGAFWIFGEKEDKGFPTKSNLEFVAPAAPGGGWDSTARAIKKVVRDNDLMPEANLIVRNKPGAGGDIGWKYTKDKDGHTIAMSSSLIFLNELTGKTELNYGEFTPIATLTNEWIGTAVANDSGIEKPQDLIEKLKEDPKSLDIAIAPGRHNDDHLSMVSILKEAGVDISEVTFVVTKTSELIPQLLGGFVDVIQLGFADLTQYHKTDKLNVLAITADERYEEYPTIPTWKESGVDIVFPHWRGIIAPGDMSEEAVKYWSEKIEKAVNTEEWDEICENNGWDQYYKDATETKELLDEQYEMYKGLIEELEVEK